MKPLRARDKKDYKSLPTNSGLKLTILRSKICNVLWSGRYDGTKCSIRDSDYALLSQRNVP
jgi:hypothetical protein